MKTRVFLTSKSVTMSRAAGQVF